MGREYEKIGDIKETHSLRVSARGNGLCFYIPKEITDLYAFLSGDMVKLEFRDHFRKKKEDDDQEGGGEAETETGKVRIVPPTVLKGVFVRDWGCCICGSPVYYVADTCEIVCRCGRKSNQVPPDVIAQKFKRAIGVPEWVLG